MAKWQASKSDMSPRKGYIPEINPLEIDGDNDKCNKCGAVGELTMHHYPITDECCGACGEWQDGTYNDTYTRIG